MRTKSTALRPRPVHDFGYGMKHHTGRSTRVPHASVVICNKYTEMYKKKSEICCEVYTNISPPRKIGLHHLPIGEVGPSIKCSHLSLSGCGMGSLETCTHIISRPINLFFIRFCCHNLLSSLFLLFFFYFYLG